MIWLIEQWGERKKQNIFKIQYENISPIANEFLRRDQLSRDLKELIVGKSVNESNWWMDEKHDSNIRTNKFCWKLAEKYFGFKTFNDKLVGRNVFQEYGSADVRERWMPAYHGFLLRNWLKKKSWIFFFFERAEWRLSRSWDSKDTHWYHHHYIHTQ